MESSLVVSPGPKERTVVTAEGAVLSAPADWELLPPGDAALTRRVKAEGPAWTVQEKRGRKRFSKGVWAPAERIARIRSQLKLERADPAHERRLATARKRRGEKEAAYAEQFQGAVLSFLGFAEPHAELAQRVAAAVAQHATPVGSGTVARTQRIPIERRAEAAVIAWMRHRTTEYDEMKIARVKGKRREVRRELAEQSRQLLARYRQGQVVPGDCPLTLALEKSQ